MGWEGTETPTVARRVGLNMVAPGYDNYRMYKNLARHGSQFQLYDLVGGIIVPCTCDSDGYPSTVPANHYAFSTVETQYGARVGAHVYTGAHRVTWEGDAVVSIVNTLAGTRTFVDSGDTFLNTEGVIIFEVWYVNPADPIRNVEIYEEQYVNDHDDLFYPEYIESIEGLNIYSFDHWHLNSGYQGAMIDWADRTTSSAYSYNAQPNFTMPIEDVVALCNRIQADLWFAIPVKANPDYVEGLVAYLHDNLDKVAYLSYGSETWNDPVVYPGYYANAWLRAQGLALGLSMDPVEAQALAAAYYADIALQAASDYCTANSLNRYKFRFCLCFYRPDLVTIAAQIAFVRDVNPLSALLDVLATHSYHGIAWDVPAMEAVLAACADEDDVLDLFVQPSVAAMLVELDAAATWINAQGMIAAIYEGNHHWSIENPAMRAHANYPTYLAWIRAMLASDRYIYLMNYILNRIFADFNGPVFYFCSTSRAREWWLWGAMEDANDPDTRKMDALRGFARALDAATWYVRLNDAGLDYGDQANPFHTVTRALDQADNGDTILCAGDGFNKFDECVNLNRFHELLVDQWDGQPDAILDYASGVGDCATVRKTTGWGTGTIDIKVPWITCWSASLTAVAVLLANCNVESQVVRIYSEIDQYDSVAAINFYNHIAGRIQVYGNLGFGGNGPVVESGYQKGGTIEILSPYVSGFGVTPLVFLLDQEGGAFRMDGVGSIKIGPYYMFCVANHVGGTAHFTRLELLTFFPIGDFQFGIYVENSAAGVVFERVAMFYNVDEPMTFGALLVNSQGTAIRNCGIKSGDAGIATWGCSDLDIRNNIVIVPTGGTHLALDDGANPGHTIDGNCYYGPAFSVYEGGVTYASFDAWKRRRPGTPHDRASWFANPNVSDLAVFPPNWRLKRTSICRDAGVICPLITSTDMDGNQATHINPHSLCGRGATAIDIGPYEFSSDGQSLGVSKRYGQPIYGLQKDSSPVVRGWFLG